MNDLVSETRTLIVGLGNPGRSYRGNRHNIGYMVIDRLADRYTIRLARAQKKAIVGDGRVHERAFILAKPHTYMNASGDSVSQLVQYYKISSDNLLVVYDEIDLPFGVLRLREKGGSGGHNGMKSIIKHLGTDFPRLRLGVGRPPGRMEPAAYVLQDFSKDELPILGELLDKAVKAVETYLREGIDMAMSRHNGSVEDQVGLQEPGSSTG